MSAVTRKLLCMNSSVGACGLLDRKDFQDYFRPYQRKVLKGEAIGQGQMPRSPLYDIFLLILLQ